MDYKPDEQGQESGTIQKKIEASAAFSILTACHLNSFSAS
jgi:hypothetical protein